MSQRIPNPRTFALFPRQISLLQKQFQWKYTSFLIVAVAIASVLSGGAAYYFINQNYEIFLNLSMQYAPKLVPSLEREKLWITQFLVAFLLGVATFYFYLGLKMTSRLIFPIVVLHNHIKGLIRGNFNQPPIKIRDDDEFHELIDTYNYFNAALSLQAKKDLERLKNISIDPQNIKSRHLWEELIEEKTKQVDISNQRRLA